MLQLYPEIGYSFDLTKYQLQDISVKVRSLGNETNLVTGVYSDAKVINRISSVTNLKITNGVITWDVHSTAGATYQVFVSATPDDENSFTQVSATITQNDTQVMCVIPSLESEVKYGVKVVAVIDGLLYSAPSSVLKITKLPIISNFAIAKGTFSWQQVENATKYVVEDLWETSKKQQELH